MATVEEVEKLTLISSASLIVETKTQKPLPNSNDNSNRSIAQSTTTVSAENIVSLSNNDVVDGRGISNIMENVSKRLFEVYNAAKERLLGLGTLHYLPHFSCLCFIVELIVVLM